MSACSGGGDDPTPTAAIEPTATVAVPTQTAVPVTPTISPSLEGLLDPGPTAQSPPQIIFRNAGSLWTIAVDGTTRRLTEGLRFEAWAQTISGSLAAIVVINDEGEQATEDVRLVTAEGVMTAPIYGPVPVTGPDAQPEIQSIAWAWDATALAMLRSDGSIAALVNLNDPFADNSQPLMLNTPDTAVADSGLTWAPSGDGVAYLAFNEAGYYSVFLSPRDEAPFPLLMSESGNPRSVAAFTWLPGRGRIAFVEDSPVPGSRTPSSIFTIFADGSGLELLVSAGRFAPAAMIGALNPSPDGRELAFIVYVPNDQGRPTFQSLWILQIDTGDLRQVPIEPGYRVTDTWFASEGLIWRGVDVGARVTGDGTTYTGIEPFILGRFDANGNTTLMFQSSLAEAE